MLHHCDLYMQKLDDASKLTPEILAEKQRVAEENRQKELNKRADVGNRLSKKDRLRREIQDARFSERVLQLEETERKLSASEENRLRQQEETKDRLRRREEHAKKVRVSLHVTTFWQPVPYGTTGR